MVLNICLHIPRANLELTLILYRKVEPRMLEPIRLYSDYVL